MRINLFKPTTLLLAITLLFSGFAIPVSAAGALPDIGISSSYGLLGATATVSAGLTVNGDLGAGGLTGSGTVTGSTNVANAAYTAAHTALDNAIANASAQSADFTVITPTDIGGTVLTPGVHKYSAAVNVGSNTTLDGPGVYIFNIAGALGTTAGTVFRLLNGANVCNIYWVVDVATLGANSTFSGTLMSRSAITLGANSVTIGRILARTAVTANAAATAINVPAGCTAPAPTPASTPVPTPVPVVVSPLTLTTMCTDNPIVSRKWLVHNPNAADVNYNYTIEGSTQVIAKTIKGNTDQEIIMNTAGTNKLDVMVDGVVQATLTSVGATCAVTLSTTTPAPSATPTGTAAVCPTAAPVGDKLIGTSASLSVWLVPNGNLIINVMLPNNETGTGTWNFNLGGKTYSVKGNECVSYTAASAPVGTYQISAQFVPTAGLSSNLAAVTVSVPTVTGGKLPNTATPWYNFLLIGAILALVGAVVWRVRKVYE